jgi:hypothetical protein
MDTSSTNQSGQITPAVEPQPAITESMGQPAPSGWSASCEYFIKQFFGNRYIWLIFGCAVYLNGQLTFLQWSTARHGAEQFDTLELMSHLLVIIELAVLGQLMLMLGSTGQAIRHWREHYSQARFPYFAHACAAQLTAACLMLIQLLLLLYPHSYPQLLAEGINVPLMLMQRSFLIFLALCFSYNLGLLIRFYTRLPWQLCALVTAAVQLTLGYTVTIFSLRYDALVRLNSVFYYNELSHYIPAFPRLQHANLFHNIQMPYYGYYSLAVVVASLFLTALWLPRAIALGNRETKV